MTTTLQYVSGICNRVRPVTHSYSSEMTVTCQNQMRDAHAFCVQCQRRSLSVLEGILVSLKNADLAQITQKGNMAEHGRLVTAMFKLLFDSA